MTGHPRLLPKRGFTEQVYNARKGEKSETLIRLLTDQEERQRKERCRTDYKARMSTGPEEEGRQTV